MTPAVRFILSWDRAAILHRELWWLNTNIWLSLNLPKVFKKAKAVPLHAMKAPVGRRGIARTHSWTRHYMGVSGQCHTTAALYPRRKEPWYPLYSYKKLGGPQSRLDTEDRGKIFRVVFWVIMRDHPWWWRQYAPLTRRSAIILHGSITQKTTLNIILAAVRTWNLT
jgi:hypothetical protein